MNIINKLKKDTRGAALVYVIVAAAIVILLAAATTVTAYVNLQTTKIEKHSNDNFYNADAVMNAILGGLQSDMSIAYDVAYTKIMTTTYSTQDEVKEQFDFAFKDKLFLLLNDGRESSELFYSPSHIKGYVQKVFPDDLGYTVTALNGNNYIDVTETGFVLRNLHVTYENDNGYYDEITTDIKIDIPDPGDMTSNEVPAFQFNAFVVDDGLEINVNNGLQINGNVYINEREEDKSAILLNNGTLLYVTVPNEMIAGGNIQTKENTVVNIKGLNNQYENKIWVENIDFGRYTIANISGQIYVYDDVEINGSYSNVKLAGKYYGYGKSNTSADESSSINVNGAVTKLDIKDLTRLVIAGSSYISTSTVESGKEDNNQDIQLGEAFSVKSNQIAYLVDDTEFAGSKLFGFVSNPMSETQYNEMCSANGGTWDKVAKLMEGHVLSYGNTYAGYGANVVRVFRQGKYETEVYFYLDFETAEQAANFFRVAYKGNTLLSQRLRTYAAQYISELTLSSDTELLVNENYINSAVTLYTKDKLPTIMDGFGYKEYETAKNTIDQLLDQCKTQYFGNGTPSGDGEKYKVTYDKLINSAQLTTFIQNATKAQSVTSDGINNTDNKIKIIDNGVVLTGTSGSQAILVDNDGKAAYRLGTGSGLVVVSGDLELTGDWLGTIIVGGRIYCASGTTVSPLNVTIDSVAVSSVTPLYFTLKTGDTDVSMSVLNIFNGYDKTSINSATVNGIDAEKISKCITFTNWDRY